MRRMLRLLAAATLGVGLIACGNDDTDETVDDVTDDVEEGAQDAWASIRTNWERLVDEASTGDDEAQDELLGECRDALQDLREEGHDAADDVQSLCDEIRDADEDADWDGLRSEFERLDAEL